MWQPFDISWPFSRLHFSHRVAISCNFSAASKQKLFDWFSSQLQFGFLHPLSQAHWLLPLPCLPVLFGSSANAPFHCSRNATRPVVYTSVLTAARFVFFSDALCFRQQHGCTIFSSSHLITPSFSLWFKPHGFVLFQLKNTLLQPYCNHRLKNGNSV